MSRIFFSISRHYSVSSMELSVFFFLFVAWKKTLFKIFNVVYLHGSDLAAMFSVYLACFRFNTTHVPMQIIYAHFFLFQCFALTLAYIPNEEPNIVNYIKKTP